MKYLIGCLFAIFAFPLWAAGTNSWLEVGNVDDEFDGRYLGFSSYKGHLGLQVGTIIPHEKLYFVSDDEPDAATESIADDGLVFLPLNIGVMTGFDINERLTPYASLGLMYWERCDVIKDSADQYCSNQASYFRLVPGVGVQAKLLRLSHHQDWDHFSLMANYHYRLGMGSSFGLGLSFPMPQSTNH
ncbi:hypothetical protein [Saccharospirillum mangrovi]|uniref:hypothetical protein n=1 Tax=Saccharospirillum mangrovi TaxID=2161747 RepID=UPI000D345A62|nr:hypothetical protein [Saccharospirillum mangrovi]